mgnify:CR=1 FL=1
MKTRIVAAMSGGVDSSVVAALLRGRGYEVIGVTLRMFRGLKGGSAEDTDRAASNAEAIGIEHHYIDAEEIFRDKVINYFSRSYAGGLTPNPCVLCNRYVKFGYLFDVARKFGADRIATGHYAGISEKDGVFSLKRAGDAVKDQSYFLFGIAREKLSKISFPLEDISKEEVRKTAAGLKLPSASRSDSQDICFMEGRDYVSYLKHYCGLESAPGYITDAGGRILGRHNGYFNFTIGQRKGLGVYGTDRLYVTDIDAASNKVVLGSIEQARRNRFFIKDYNALSDMPSGEFRTSVQIRHRHRPAPCAVKPCGDGYEVLTDTPQFAVTPGQAAVFYEGEKVLGGGFIQPGG